MEIHKNLHNRLQQKSSVCELIILFTAPATSGIVTIIKSKRGLLVVLILLVVLTVIIASCSIRNAKKFTENNMQGARLSLTQEIDKNRAVSGLCPGGSNVHSTLTSLNTQDTVHLTDISRCGQLSCTVLTRESGSQLRDNH